MLKNILASFVFAFVLQVEGQIFDCSSTVQPINTICMPARQACIDDSNPPRGLDDSSLENYILSLHNIRRARVAAGAELRGNPGPQPGSQCMAKLAWNNELAATAQRWADQCTMATDANRNRNISTDSYAGQNVYAYIDPLNAQIRASLYPEVGYWEQAITSWFDEVSSFNASGVGSYVYSAATGHYSQMVWGRTTQIGCGFRRWIMADNRYGRILVCNYWPGGNRVGDPIYQSTGSANPSPSCTARTCSAATATSFAGRRIPGNGYLCEIQGGGVVPL